MTLAEIAAIGGGLFLGYWLVGSFAKVDTNKEKSLPPDTQQSANPPDNNDGNVNLENSWYQILEVDINSSWETIVDSYKHKIAQYHPDKVATMGPEIRMLAESKSREINAAFEYAERVIKRI